MNNKRRKELRRAIDMIETALDIVNSVKDEEEDAMCNYPESLQGTRDHGGCCGYYGGSHIRH